MGWQLGMILSKGESGLLKRVLPRVGLRFRGIWDQLLTGLGITW